MSTWKDEENISKENHFIQVVTFTIAEEDFAFDIFKVKEIIRIVEVTKVPKSPDFIEGVINLRGNVIPILDLRKRFHLKPREYDKKTRIIVVEANTELVGFIVDAVLETRSIFESCIEAPPTIVLGGIESEYLKGVAKLEDRLVILLDIGKILSVSEQQALKEG